ncbi:MAG: pyridoxamine 5'-phosphate oxidase family protein [Acidimicrobiales bacterium]
MIAPSVRAFLEAERAGVLSTIRPDGRARQSVVYFLLEGDHILVSTEPKRGKAKDVERSGWASLCVMGREPPFPSVTVEGAAALRVNQIADHTARLFARISGDEPPELTDELLAGMDRVLLDIEIGRAYGASYLPAE